MRAFGFLAIFVACGVPSIDDYCKASPGDCAPRTWDAESDLGTQDLVACDRGEVLDLTVCGEGPELDIAQTVQVGENWRYLYGADGKLFQIDHFGPGRDGVRAHDDPSDDTPDVEGCLAAAVGKVTLRACVPPPPPPPPPNCNTTSGPFGTFRPCEDVP